MDTLANLRHRWFALTDEIKKLELERRECAKDAFEIAENLRRTNDSDLARFRDVEATFREQTGQMSELLDARKDVADRITRWYFDRNEIDWWIDSTGKSAVVLSEPELDYIGRICPENDPPWTVSQRDYAITVSFETGLGRTVFQVGEFETNVLRQLKNLRRDARDNTFDASSAIKYHLKRND